MRKNYDFHGRMDQAREWAEVLYNRVDAVTETLIVIRGTIHAKLSELERLQKLLPSKRAKALFPARQEDFLKLVQQALDWLTWRATPRTRPLRIKRSIEPSNN
jgi:hypothetical protein